MKWFFKEMFNGNGAISSKIVLGVIILLNAIVMGYVRSDVPEVINAFLLTGGTLLGVSIAKEIVSSVGTKGAK